MYRRRQQNLVLFITQGGVLMIDAKKTGAFIAECRKEKQWTQKQLGEQLGVTDRAVSKWETGRSLPDISLIEPLCTVFEISVSEFLSGKKIKPEEYRKETENLLIKTIGEHQLLGFQVVLHLLSFLAVLACYVPFILERDTWLPALNPGNGLCWLSAAVLTGIIWYLDKNLPARKYRSSNAWIEGAAGICLFGAIVVLNLHNAGGIQALGEAPARDKIAVGVTAAAGLAIVVGGRVIISHIRREEWEQEKNSGKE